MAMQATFGALGEKTEGLFKRVDWPSLATMNERTGDGRLLQGDGGGVRNLPRTGFAQFAQEPGHYGSVAALRLDEVTFNEDDNISGRGWIADTEEGHKLAVLMAAKVLFHNSVDLTEVEYEHKWGSDDPSSPDYWKLEGIDFTKWSIGATTIVGKPAFANARGEIVASLLSDNPDADEIIAALQCDDEWWAEITAALESDEPLIGLIDGFSIVATPLTGGQREVVASDTAVILPWADFHMPESPTPQKIVVTPDGAVFGHLGLWDKPHGATGQPVPRPRDHYASFNQAGPLTENGQVETGPIFFLGGHPDHPLGARTANQAYGGVENSWADVRVTEGALGPWLSGRVRPDMTETAIHTARCSRISGHWKGGDLVAIVSVNVPAYNVPGTGLAADRGGEELRDGVLELVASLHGPDDTPETAYTEYVASQSAGLTDAQRDEVRQMIAAAKFGAPSPSFTTGMLTWRPDGSISLPNTNVLTLAPAAVVGEAADESSREDSETSDTDDDLSIVAEADLAWAELS